MLVQVVAAAHGGKGAVLTRAVSLQGHGLAYTPARPGLNLSRRIADPLRRAALRQLLEGAMAEGEGVVVRTAAGSAGDQALLAELTDLRGRWRRVLAAAEKAAPAAVIDAPPALARLLAAHPGVMAVRVDDRAALAEVKRLFPDAVHQTRCFEDEAAESFDQALERRIALPGGGALIIEQTAALVAIDIDGGGGSPLAANLAAMPEIARQLRLRDLSGHILIDVIPLKDRDAQARVVAALREAVAGDPTPTHVNWRDAARSGRDDAGASGSEPGRGHAGGAGSAALRRDQSPCGPCGRRCVRPKPAGRGPP